MYTNKPSNILKACLGTAVKASHEIYPVLSDTYIHWGQYHALSGFLPICVWCVFYDTLYTYIPTQNGEETWQRMISTC